MSSGPAMRLACFLGVFIVMAVWEVLARRRPHSTSTPLRWTWNLGLAVANMAIMQALGSIVFAGLAVGVAYYAQERGWGVFNWLPIPSGLVFLLSLALLDLAIYLQHFLSHKIHVLWRFHRVHHSDRDLDVTSALRFHPVEIVCSMGYKMVWVAALGVPPFAVIVFEVLLNGMAMFNHGNVRLPGIVDSVLRWFVVTPDMHRVHHSDQRAETDSNYGFNLSWWDRLFRTYRRVPEGGHLGMTLGLVDYPNPQRLHLVFLLLMPFIPAGKPTSSDISPTLEE